MWFRVNSYPDQLVPRPTRTQTNSYPNQLVPRPTLTQTNSYPDQLVPRPTRTQTNSYPDQLLPKPTRTQTNSYPDQRVPRSPTSDQLVPNPTRTQPGRGYPIILLSPNNVISSSKCQLCQQSITFWKRSSLRNMTTKTHWCNKSCQIIPADDVLSLNVLYPGPFLTYWTGRHFCCPVEKICCPVSVFLVTGQHCLLCGANYCELLYGTHEF